jgi:hypothetical protein
VRSAGEPGQVDRVRRMIATSPLDGERDRPAFLDQLPQSEAAPRHHRGAAHEGGQQLRGTDKNKIIIVVKYGRSAWRRTGAGK